MQCRAIDVGEISIGGVEQECQVSARENNRIKSFAPAERMSKSGQAAVLFF